VVSETDPYHRSFDFLDRSHYFFSFKWLPNCTHDAEWTLLQTHCLSENLVAPGIEPTSGSVARSSDHLTTEAVHKSGYEQKTD
jgi:hypothetical protein